jgi:hypothetical protein
VVEISRPSEVALSSASKAPSGGTGNGSLVRRQISAERLPVLAQIFRLRAVIREAQVRHLVEILVRHRDLEPVAESFQGVVSELLRLMGDHLALARRAHSVALHRLGEDDGRLALVLDRRLIGGIDLDRIVAAAGQRPDFGVGPICDHRGGFRVTAEEVFADIGAVLGLEVLVFPVDALFHQLAQLALGIPGEEFVPARAPQALDHVPAGAAEVRLELLNDLAVAPHRPVEPLKIAVDDEDQIVEFLPAGQRNGAERLRLIHLAVAAEDPHFARRRVSETSPVQIAQEAGLIDPH